MKKLEDILNACRPNTAFDRDLLQRAEELDLDLHWWMDIDNAYAEDHVFDNC